MKIIGFICFFIAVHSCNPLNKIKDNSVFTANGYYFIIQIKSFNSDTIYFEPIAIYSSSPILEISPTDSSVIQIVKLPLKKYSKGYLKGIKKRNIGDVMLLYAKPEWIENKNFINLDYIKHLEWTDLSKMYRVEELPSISK